MLPRLPWTSSLLVVVLAGSCSSPPSSWTPTGPSWFEPTLLASGGIWTCEGLVDLNGDGQLELVLFQEGAVQIQSANDPTAQVLDNEILPVYGDATVGCASADFNGDGRPDLAVAGQKSGTVLLNEGNFHFTQVQLPAFPTADSDTETFIVAPIDADNDGFPDLYLARNAIDGAEAFLNGGCVNRADGSFFCGVPGMTYPGKPSILLHNLGGTGWAVVPDSGAEDGRQSQGVVVVDVDGDGLQDLVVANDAGVNRIYRSLGNLLFDDVSDMMGLTQTDHGMGVAAGDLNGDGILDFGFSTIGQPLVVLGGKAGYQKLGLSNGLPRTSTWAWGVSMEDFDNDGALDLLYESNVQTTSSWYVYCRTCGMELLPRNEMVLYRNDGHADFTLEVPVNLPDNDPPDSSSAAGGGTSLAVTDVNGDGVLDAVILRESATGQQIEAWLLQGKLKTPAASVTIGAPMGARVTACLPAGACQTREITGIDSFRAFRPHEAHFGIGTAIGANVLVEYPHGKVTSMGFVPAGRATFKPAG